jgi:hypothetical protein
MRITGTGDLSLAGNVTSGTWQGTAIADAYISSSTNWNTAYTHSQVTSGNPHSVTKSDVGLGNVENTALSTWAGSANVTTLGTITTGTWNGSTVGVAYGGTGSTSFTSGSVVFSNGTILTQDNANFFWDDSNNRLGLGTATPSSTLHVADGNISLTNSAGVVLMDVTGAGSGTMHSYLRLNRSISQRGAGVKVRKTSATANEWFVGAPYNGGSTNDHLYINYQAGSSSERIDGANITNRKMIIRTDGQILKPYNSRFCAQVTSVVLSVTGDGTTYTVPFGTERFDRNNDFSSTTYTAPVTGDVYFCASVRLDQLSSTDNNNTYTGQLVTSNHTYPLHVDVFPAGTFTNVTLHLNQLADMDAGDTAYVTVRVSGTAKNVDLNTGSYFSGFLVG